MDFRRLVDAGEGTTFDLDVNGSAVKAVPGDTVATALLASGRTVMRKTHRNRASRSVFCGIGVCFDCCLTVNGVSDVRACVTDAAAGMRVEIPADGGRANEGL